MGGKSKALKEGLSLIDDFLTAVAKPAAKPKAAQEVVSAAERDANLAKFLEQSKVKERLYRGAVGFEPSGMPEGFLNAEPREGYAVFASTNPAIANTYAMPEHEDWGGKMIGAVTPLHVQAKRLIEFPNFEKAPNFDKFEFDRWAQNLKPGEVLVVRNVTDTGPRSTYKVDPQKLHTYGSDIYAWNKGTSAKSATGNRGTYDPKDPDITKAKGGAIKKGLGLVDEFLKDIAKPAAKAIPVAETRIIQAPAVVTPSNLTEIKEAVRQSKGGYGARRVERAADEIPNLERIYNKEALKRAFTGDNAAAMMTMNPKDFERYAKPLDARFTDEFSTRQGRNGQQMSYREYMENYLPNVGGFDDVPFLVINKEEQGLPLIPFLTGHEGRHRNRVMASQGEQAGLVQLLPRAELREPFPRRYQEDYIEALKKELGLTDNLVYPEKYNEPGESLFDKQIQRPAIKLPDVYAKGGEVHMMGGGNPKPSKRPLSEALLALGDIIGGATRGGVKEFLGTPGDLESLVRERGLGLPANVLRLLMPTRQGKETTLPTSEDFDEYLPPVVPKGAENYDERARTADIAQSLGELNPVVPLSYSAAAKGAVKGAKAAGKGALSLAKSEPARRAVERAAEMTGTAPMNVVKNKGGNWIDTGLTPITRRIDIDKAEDLERNLAKERELYDQAFRNRGANDFWTQHHADNLKMLEANLAERRFADKNLVNYMRNQMGTEDDPIRKAIDEGYYHFELPATENLIDQKLVKDKRLSLGFPPQGLATTPKGKSWETITDMAINPDPAAYRIESDIGGFGDSLLERNPWLAKIPPDRPVYSMFRYTRPMDLGFDELLKTLNEEVLAGRIDPMNVKTIKMDDLVRLTHKRELDRQAELRRTMAANRKDLPVFKEYPEGYKWVELNKPGSFATESDAMQHSVRGYEPLKGDEDWIDLSGNSGQSTYGHGGWEAIKSGKAKVYSLVDETGTPHVTVETVRPDKTNTSDMYEVAENLRYSLGRDPTRKEVEEALALEPYKITQIKRKNNLVDTQDYPQREYVRDFVRSGFGNIEKDSENVDLRRALGTFTRNDIKELKDLGHEVPNYLTKDEARQLKQTLYSIPPKIPSTPVQQPNINTANNVLEEPYDGWLENLYGGQKKGGLVALRKRHGKG